MRRILEKQQAAFERDGEPSLAERVDRIERAIELLRTNAHTLCAASDEDFNGRSVSMALGADIVSSIGALEHARSNLQDWMSARPVSIDGALDELGAAAYVRNQPKGVVGIISPWNFPVGLVFCPLAGVLAAGNRAMVKPSELTSRTSSLIAQLVSQYFSDEEVAVVTGGVDIGAKFASLPFDHLLFTGSTAVARQVMASAASNLVPVTLELGGKSPVVIGRTVDLPDAAKKIMYGKTLNAGQICLAPDYIFAPTGTSENLVAELVAATMEMFPSGFIENNDYVSIINTKHYERIIGYVDDARKKGATIAIVDPANEVDRQGRRNRCLPHVISNVDGSMSVMTEEIFGPIVPILEYEELDDAIKYINSRPRPLGLYYFGSDTEEHAKLLSDTTSGGVTINDVMFHAAQEDLPLGGIGWSGMGAYHGKPGFDEFSHKKAVYRQADADVLALFRPPYGDEYQALVESLVGSD